MPGELFKWAECKCGTGRGTIKEMPSVNIRELRKTRQLKTWLRAGMTVELRERDSVLGHIVPQEVASKPRVWPDFAGRTQRIFGDRQLPGADIMIEERGRY